MCQTADRTMSMISSDGFSRAKYEICGGVENEKAAAICSVVGENRLNRLVKLIYVRGGAMSWNDSTQ